MIVLPQNAPDLITENKIFLEACPRPTRIGMLSMPVLLHKIYVAIVIIPFIKDIFNYRRYAYSCFLMTPSKNLPSAPETKLSVCNWPDHRNLLPMALMHASKLQLDCYLDKQ